MILLPVKGASGLHDALPRKGNDTLRLAFFEAETMPRCDILEGDHDSAYVVDYIVGVPGNGKDSAIVNPCEAIQIQITPSVLVVLTPGWLQRIAVEVLHADQAPVLDQVLAQFLDEACHARVEDQISQWITRTRTGDQPVGPLRVADTKEGVGMPDSKGPVEPLWSTRIAA